MCSNEFFVYILETVLLTNNANDHHTGCPAPWILHGAGFIFIFYQSSCPALGQFFFFLVSLPCPLHFACSRFIFYFINPTPSCFVSRAALILLFIIAPWPLASEWLYLLFIIYTQYGLLFFSRCPSSHFNLPCLQVVLWGHNSIVTMSQSCFLTSTTSIIILQFL